MEVSKLDLSNEDRDRLRGMMEGPGWKVLTEKVWAFVQSNNLARCAKYRGDHDFNQGIYEGFERAKTCAEQAALTPGEVQATAYPSEANLTSRKFVPFR